MLLLKLRHLRDNPRVELGLRVRDNTRVELGLRVRDNTRVGLVIGRAAWTPRGVHEVHAEIWTPFPRMARGKGAPRGRRVEIVPGYQAPTTHGAWKRRAAWTPRGNSTRVPCYHY